MPDVVAALIGMGGVVLGIILQEILSSIKNKKDEKSRFLMGNYNLRKQSYVDIYSALIEYENYFKLFIYPGHDFHESEHYTSFGPLETITAFKEIFYKNEIWLDNSTAEKINKLLNRSQISNHLALQLCMDNSFITEEMIVNECMKILSEINGVKELIKKVCGMTELDNYCNNLSNSRC